jgi:hypothetical protein
VLAEVCPRDLQHDSAAEMCCHPVRVASLAAVVDWLTLRNA